MGTANLTPVHARRELWRADLALAGIALVWGVTFVVVKQALQDVSTLLFLALRFSLATLALGAAFRPLPGKFTERRTLLVGGILAGLCLAAGYVFQTVGLRFTSPSKSAFLTGLSIVLVPVFGAGWRRRWPARPEVAGILAATVGMSLMTLNWDTLRIERGDLLTLACALGFAAHILVVGHYSPRVSFQALALVQVATAAALAVATCWWIEPPMIRWTPGVVLALIVTGLLATALAFSVQAWAQQHTTPTHTALIFALEPVFAWLTSFLLAGEILSPRATLGAALILAGILLVELKPFAARNVLPNRTGKME
jgi:drug/metabolite transporter (DMT)-like permease